jgi:hypothetical protein
MGPSNPSNEVMWFIRPALPCGSNKSMKYLTYLSEESGRLRLWAHVRVVGLRPGSTSGEQHMTNEQERVNTGGGAYFGGSVSAGRDVIGGDKLVLGDEGASGAELAQLFAPVYAHIGQTAAARGTDAASVTDTVRNIQGEAGKAEAADPKRIEGWLTTLADLAPDVLETVVTALTNPGAAVANAVRIAAEQFRARAP